MVSPETWPIDSDFLDTSDKENALAINVLPPPAESPVPTKLTPSLSKSRPLVDL